MPSVIDYVKVGLILFALGTVTSAAGSLLLAGVFKDAAVRFVVTVFAIVLAVAFALLALLKNDSQLNKINLWLLAVLEIVVAIATPLIPYKFHDDSAYLNRVVVYFIILVALISGLAALWRFPTLIFSGELFEAAGVDKAQETLLYVLWGVLISFIIAWFLPLKETYQRNVMFDYAVKNSVGFYFVGGLLSGLLGIIILVKGGAGSSSTASLSVASGGPSDYDKVTG
jgi:cytochrome bd-type quinol oxidase subunit 2